MAEQIRYVLEGKPEPGETREVAPGVHWLRMPLPFQLDHINLWLLEDGDGWTIVDTGINRDEVKAAWEIIFARHFADRPVNRVIVTHFHPDHVGLAGWLTERFGVELWMPLGEWAFGRMLKLDDGAAGLEDFRRFYRAAGFDDVLLEKVDERKRAYPRRISPIPGAFRRIAEGDVIPIGGRGWRVMVGTGHSPEHGCLYCPEIGVLISGDQVLPRISPNISVWPQEPEANPLRLYLDSLPKFQRLPADTVVLPSHDQPFTGLHPRLEQLAHHHDARLADTAAACARPCTGIDILKHLFKRELDSHQLFFAIGESLAHLHFLMGEGYIGRTRTADGVDLFRQAAPEGAEM